ncbi:hypothetical protein EPO44_18470 [bacterium]|nr:hypothetical protein [Sphingopyxis sp.]TAJ80535.1 MAG: hypothetical protein EPO44_18470 [bacterium]
MLSFYTRTDLENAAALSLPNDIKALLDRRIVQIFNDGLADHTHLVVVFAEDTEAALVEEIAFSPLEQEGHRYGTPSFVPRWDILHDHGGWFELVFCIGNAGWAVVLLIQDAQFSSFPDLRVACRGGILKT